MRRRNVSRNSNSKRLLSRTIRAQQSSTTLQQQQQLQQEGIFGLTPVTYSAEAPPRLYRSPPAPPLNKPGGRKYFLPFTLILTFGLTAYFYFNNQNDAFEYWETMQVGGELIDDDDDEDDEEFIDEDVEE